MFDLIQALKGRAKFIPTLRVEEMNWGTRALETVEKQTAFSTVPTATTAADKSR
ncbi:MAG: hypothetical protein M3Y84_09665 [Acidobacteriota bacterium]|nr:hypothetical protein [Acidobacteriota bacterium]